MIFLNGNTDSLKLFTSSVAEIDYSIVYVDMPSITTLFKSNEGKIITATSTEMLNDSTPNTKRSVKSISLRNSDGAISNTVTLKKLINSIYYSLTPDIVLLPGEVYEYNENMGWKYYAADGSVKSSNTGIVASGDLSGTYPGPSVVKIRGNTIPMNSIGFFYNDGTGNISWQAASSSSITGLSIVPGGGSGINELDTAGGYTFGKLVAALKASKIIT